MGTQTRNQQNIDNEGGEMLSNEALSVLTNYLKITSFASYIPMYDGCCICTYTKGDSRTGYGNQAIFVTMQVSIHSQ